MNMSEQGTLYGVGVGPGDPKLLTLRSIEVMQSVPVVFAANSVKNKYSLALETVKGWLRPETEVRFMSFPMTFQKDVLGTAWKENAETVVETLNSGRDAAFITIGDPLTYSTYCYLIRAIRMIAPEVKMITIPGITSYNAAAARVNMPLVEGKECLLIVSGVCEEEKIKNFVELADNIAILKTYKNFDQICDALGKHSMNGHCISISRLGMEGERIESNIQKLHGGKMPYLSLLLIKNNGNEGPGLHSVS